MKELSIEEKAKCYDEAIERAKGMHEQGMMSERLEYIFPELKESEDENIKKEIMSYIKSSGAITNKQWIAWLEKQGDANKEYWRGYREGKQEILDKYAEFEKQGADSLPKDNWELIHEFVNKFGRIPKDEDELNVLIEYVLKRQKPTDIIPQDFEKYVEHLLSLSDGEGHGSPAKLKEVCSELLGLAKLQQKSAWSEEDEKMKDAIYSCVDSHYDGLAKTSLLIWLKYLEERVQPKQEWSEEDEKMIRALLSICDIYSTKTSFYPKENKDIERLKNWLKSIKLQKQWKPSDEQMKTLRWWAEYGTSEHLKTLYEELKKLREE